ncbi:FecR domain-containing protein [Chloroherpeton thalassium]|uniref:FecR domain-containing protein n=1 Tax=Chloroherpeton thalassium TaxID=100716 RepID=UPI00145FCEE1|nr:FecR domain-containing protein [Chloroherpeton thalassium]
MLSAIIAISPIQTAYSQYSSVKTFFSGELQSVAKKITGDPSTWPMVIAEAHRYESSNQFYLSTTAYSRLLRFAEQHKKVQAAREKMNELIKTGAVLFAELELKDAKTGLSNYHLALQKGAYDDALANGKNFVQQVSDVESTLNRNRLEAISAKLEEKIGKVHKREGLLGSWLMASEGDFFEESDGVKTYDNSSATLAFVDGSYVFVEAASTAIVRKARLDKLNQAVKTDISLINGNLLAKLSRKAQDAGGFHLSTQSSDIVVQSGKFWASSVQSGSRISNYDGLLKVRAGRVEISLKKNEGTVVLKGKPPLPPVELLPAPRLKWAGLDTVYFGSNFLIEWNPLQNTETYQIEISDTRNFGRVIRRYNTPKLSYEVRNLTDAMLFIRIHGLDRYGLRGIDSQTYRLLRSPDTEPPYLRLTSHRIQNGVIYTLKNEIQIEGETESGAALYHEGKTVAVDQNGRFSLALPIAREKQMLALEAKDQAGNRQNLTLEVVKFNLERIGTIRTNATLRQNTLFVSNMPLQIYGKAYPYQKIMISYGKSDYEVNSDADGNWAIAIQDYEQAGLTISILSPDDGVPVTIKSFSVKKT